MFRQNQDMIRSNYICKSYDKSDKCEIEKQEINKEARTDFSSESQIIKTEKSRSIVENESQVNSETDKISQETIKENFPFPTFLEDQLEILTEIVDAIEEGYKYIILESGIGKSAIAATLANIYESSFILSDNKKLQEKYHEEYDLINNDKFHVSNHSDAFNEFEKLDKRKLLIVDDAHKFDENIADFFSYKIRLSAFDYELIDSFYCDVRDIENKEVDVGLDFINHLSLAGEKVKNFNLTDVELKDNLEEIDSKILDKQMSIVIGEITRNRTTKQAAKKANVKIDEVYRWYLEGKKGNEKFEDFADDYHEFYVEAGCEIFQNFLSKGKTPEQIMKIMNEDITKEDYEFWIKNNLITDKNVEAKLYTEDEIKEKIKNGGFRQKEEKSLSGLSIICC